MEGLAAGLAALPPSVEAAYATGCDVPLSKPAFVRRMFELLGDDSIAVPVCGGFQHPLAAVYRPSLLELIERDARRRPPPPGVFVRLRANAPGERSRIAPRSIRSCDTLKNLNHPADYLAALAEAGFAAPPDVLEKLQPLDTRVKECL